MDALTAAGDDKNKRWEVFKKYAMHLINPLSNVFKKDFSTNKSTPKIDNPITEGMDHEVSMAHNSLRSIMLSCVELMDRLGDDERDIPGWIQDHITNAENYIDQAAQGFHELGGHDDDEEEDDDSEEPKMIQPVAEKKLTKAEKAKKEEIIKAMAKKGGGKEKMGPKQYAIATAQAKKSAE
jgi:hypothetical protein